MSAADELEPQQYGKHYWEEDVPLADVRKSTLRKFIYMGLGVFIVLMLLGAFVKFPDQVELAFVLKSESPDESYRFPYPVYVTEKYAQVGTKVKKGQPLVKITAPEIVVLINDYEEAQKSLDNYRQQKNLSTTDQHEIIATRIRETQSKMAALKSELASLERTWKSNSDRLEFEYERAEKNLASNRELFKGKYISKNELREYEEAHIRAADARNTAKLSYEKESNNLNALVSQYALSIMSMDHELGKLSADTKYDSSSLINQLQTARNRISNTYGDFDIAEGSLVLKAGGDGVMAYMFEGDKEVQASAILLKINHKNTGLYSSVSCPPTMIGKIRKGQPAYLKVATFPAYEWGSAKGHIDNHSLTYDEKGDFNIRIAIDEYRKLEHMLQPGMIGNVTVVLQERTFFQYFFRTINRTYYKVTMND